MDGARKTGSEVCFYGGTSAADAFSLFFSYGHVRCLPADQVLDLPPGLFHAFARHPDGLVSAQRDFFVYRGDAAPEAGYEELEIALGEAGLADFRDVAAELRPGQSVGVWLAPSSGTRGTFFPLVDGEATIMVPAGTPFVPILVQGGRPLAVGTASRVGTGERQRVPRFTSVRGHSDVVVWTKLDLDGASPSVALPSPEITVVSGEEVRAPLFPLGDPLGATHTLLIFKDIAAGTATLRVGGRMWVQSERAVEVGGTVVVSDAGPLLLVPAAALRISWSPGSAESGASSECLAAEVWRPEIAATLLRCTEAAGGAAPVCRPAARTALVFGPAGSMVMDGLQPGQYTLSVSFPFHDTPMVVPASLVAGVETRVTVPLSLFAFFGTVTLNGSPLQARLIFASGEARSDETGGYTASLASDPRTNHIRVVTCSEGRVLTFVVPKPILENLRYDIALRTRSVRVSVRDERGSGVEDARVHFSPVHGLPNGEMTQDYSSPPKHSDASGAVIFDEVPRDETLVVCATHRSYARHCTEPLTAAQTETNSVVIRLRAVTARGKIVGHEGEAVLTWVDPGGRVTEQVAIGADGEFSLQVQHGPLEHLIYVSGRRPLTVMPWAVLAGAAGDVVVALPAAPARSFAVTVPGMKERSGFVGLWVDGRYVPLDVLRQHLELRGVDVMIHRGTPFSILDVAETGPIAVAYGPQSPDGVAFVDIFTVPPYANVARQRVAGSQVVLSP